MDTAPTSRALVTDPTTTTPQRRSLYDLQLLIDEVFERVGSSDEDGSTKTCPVANLSGVLTAFEERRNLSLLTEDEKRSLEAFAEQHPDLQVSSEQLVSLLAAMTAQNRHSETGSPTPLLNKQLPTPPPSEGESEEDDEAAERRRKASISSSSSSSSSGDSTMLTGRGSLDLPEVDSFFPKSISMPDFLGDSSPPFPSSPWELHKRAITDGDADRVNASAGLRKKGVDPKRQQDTPTSATSVSARQRSSPLDLAPKEAFKRSRPAPPKSRRISGEVGRYGGAGSFSNPNENEGRRSRQSSAEFSPNMHSPQDAILSPSFASLDSMAEEAALQDEQFPSDGRSRQSSNRSGDPRGSSPLFGIADDQHGPRAAGTSPLFAPTSPGVETTSFHPMPPISPTRGRYARHAYNDNDFSLDDSLTHLHSRPVSTVSLGSEAAMAEMITALQQELARKTQDLEAQKADGYAAVMDKEALLEEARAELAAKRREEKELRGKEKVNLNQIATLEAQTATFRDERDKQKVAYQSARKQYEEQCSESEKLRNAIRAKDEEVRLSEDNAQSLTSDLAKITRERDYLQSSINRLEEELAEARASVEALEEQKTENLQLRETIDRLRLDLDELRTQARLVQAGKSSGSSSLSRSASGSDSLPASLSRNLGRELARRMKDGDGDDGDETETEDDEIKRRHSKESTDSYEEEIITTRRRLKRPTRKAAETGASDSTPAKVEVEVKQAESVLVEVTDIGVQVDLPEKLSREMEVQTEDAPEMSADAKRAALARDLAVDLDAVEAYIREKESRARVQAQTPAIPDTAPPPYQSPPSQITKSWQRRLRPYAPAYLTHYIPENAQVALDLILHNSTNLLLYSLLIFLSGLLTGGVLLPTKHHHHHAIPFDSFSTWAALNTLDNMHGGAQAGWKDAALFWLERLVWKGVAISRRVPT